MEVHQLALWSASTYREGHQDERLRAYGNSNTSHRSATPNVLIDVIVLQYGTNDQNLSLESLSLMV